MGAVNTVVNREGLLAGYNTDWLGALKALQDETAIPGEHFLILGAGGASRAILFGLLKEGGKVAVTDLDPDRAANLASQFKVAALPLTELNRHPGGILINATPVGMEPCAGAMPIDPNLLGRFRLVMDIVYRPLETRLLKEARARGLATIDGLKMLIHQGAAQFELFTGRPAPLEVMSRAAYAALGEAS